MVIISIIFAILIPQEVQDAKLKESFKDSMAAVALLQQMDGEWKLERCNEDGNEVDYNDALFPQLTLIVSDWEITMKGPDPTSLPRGWIYEESKTEIVAFDSKLNAFKIKEKKGRLKKYDGLVTVTKDQLVFILRRPDSGNAPLGIEPAKETMYYAFGKEKK